MLLNHLAQLFESVAQKLVIVTAQRITANIAEFGVFSVLANAALAGR